MLSANQIAEIFSHMINTVIKVKYYGHMARVINTAAIYEEKTHTHTHKKTHNTHTQIKLEELKNYVGTTLRDCRSSNYIMLLTLTVLTSTV